MIWFVLLFCGLASAQDQRTAAGVFESGGCWTDMCELLKKVNAMSETLDAVKTRMNAKLQETEFRLETSEAKQQATEFRLQATEFRLQASEAKHQAAESRLQTSETKLQETESRLQASETKLQETESRLQASETKLQETESRLQASINQTGELMNKDTARVVFGAGLGQNSDSFGPFHTDVTLIYKAVRTNIGNAYNSTTGVFTAPVAGVYYFSFFYNANSFKGAYLTLYKNSEPIANAVESSSPTYLSTNNGGNAVILQLQQGDQVYVKLYQNSHVYGGKWYTTFNGFLVAEV